MHLDCAKKSLDILEEFGRFSALLLNSGGYGDSACVMIHHTEVSASRDKI